MDDLDLYGNPLDLYGNKPDPAARPARINRLIYAQIFPIKKEYTPLNKTMLKAYISGLDKTTIKSAGEYLKEVNDAPVNALLGTPMYMPPEMNFSVDELARQRNLEHTDEPIVATIHPLVPSSSPGVCDLENENLTLNDLISIVYLKYMYNSVQLQNCRDLIESKIMLGEQIDNITTIEHLKQIDHKLYEIYVDMNTKGGRFKKRKSRKMVRKSKLNRKSKSKLNRKKSKYVKKH
jgi:hypothetical protein